MPKSEKVLYAWATVELTDIVPGDPVAEPRREGDGRAILRLFRRGDVIPTELFAEYQPSPGMPVVHSDLEHLLEHGAVGWDEPGPAEPSSGEYFEIVTPSGDVVRLSGPAPDPESIQVVSGETIAQAAGAAVKEAS